jgi:rare lipoprotein A
MQAFATHVLTGLIVVAGAASPVAARAETAGRVADPTPPTYSETGQATWYGPRHEGQRTTSGERFDSRRMTAAHPSLPMGSWVRVTDAATGRSIVVRVNDREPPHGVRCIDLSRAAAARLGIIGRGVADVTVDEVGPPAADTELAEAADNDPPPLRSAHHASSARHGPRHRHHAHQ